MLKKIRSEKLRKANQHCWYMQNDLKLQASRHSCLREPQRAHSWKNKLKAVIPDPVVLNEVDVIPPPVMLGRVRTRKIFYPYDFIEDA